MVRPLYYEFPKDNLTYSIDEQFMIGKCILVCPIMNQDSSMNGATMKVYFPSGNWYDYYTGQLIIASTGVNKQIPTTLPYINMFIRGGTIFVTQVLIWFLFQSHLYQCHYIFFWYFKKEI